MVSSITPIVSSRRLSRNRQFNQIIQFVIGRTGARAGPFCPSSCARFATESAKRRGLDWAQRLARGLARWTSGSVNGRHAPIGKAFKGRDHVERMAFVVRSERGPVPSCVLIDRPSPLHEENAMGSSTSGPRPTYPIPPTQPPLRADRKIPTTPRELATQTQHVIGYTLQQFVHLAGAQYRMTPAEVAYHNREHDRTRRSR